MRPLPGSCVAGIRTFSGRTQRSRFFSATAISVSTNAISVTNASIFGLPRSLANAFKISSSRSTSILRSAFSCALRQAMLLVVPLANVVRSSATRAGASRFGVERGLKGEASLRSAVCALVVMLSVVVMVLLCRVAPHDNA